MVVYDTYAWIEYFRGSLKGRIVKKLLEENGYTPTIVLAELSRKYFREGFTADEVRKRLQFIQLKTIIVPISIELSIKAAEVYSKLKAYARENKLRTPSLADALIYSTALNQKDKLITGDKLFKNLDSIIYIGE